MRKNFVIASMGAEVVVGDRTIDLHNLYRATTLGTDLSGDMMTLVFQRDHAWRGPEGLPERVTLKCAGHLEQAFNDLVDMPAPLREDAFELGYYDAHCAWDASLDEKLAIAQGFQGLQISFSGGLVLRIRSDEAEVTIN